MYNLSQRYTEFRVVKTLVHFYSLARKSHYEVLKLKRTCTDKEIKDAFIKMSKEYHPDKNKDASAQQTFVRIVEAYNVLGKPSSRAKYDHKSDADTAPPFRSHYSYSRPDPYHVRHSQTSDYNFFYKQHNQAHREQDKNSSYYGVKGLKKVPNYIIILLCFGFAFIGSIMQAIVIREMYVVNRQKTYEQSRQLAEELEKVRDGARLNSNEIQTRILLEKIVASANPTIATASLGQALANDKKEQLESFLTEYGVSSPPKSVFNNYAECQGVTVNFYDVIRKAMVFYQYYNYKE